ncbi:MAG: putative drug exporter of the superfamily [Chloroflexota bacterium]|nr:putative drug exporter of the superfamily [Chloroflexota bacterium]
MFAAWGRLVYRYRKAVVPVAIVLALGMGFFATRVSDALSSGGWIDNSSQSAAVEEQNALLFGGAKSSLVLLYFGPAGSDARSADFQGRVAQSLSGLRVDPRVAGLQGYAPTGQLPPPQQAAAYDRFISTDGTGTFVVVELTLTNEEAVDQVDSLRAEIQAPQGLSFQVTGYAQLSQDANVQSEKDLQRAETVSLPLALLILIAVFASLVAAGMPLLVAGLAIPTTLGIVDLLAERTEMSIYVLNVSTMLGLALAIDYSLFLVSRFREELAAGRTTADAVERSVATAGKAVVFSAVAVAIGLSGLAFFKASALTSIGVAGVIVVVASAVYAVTFLPALLGILGPRVNSLSVATLLQRLGLRRAPLADAPARQQQGRWERLAHAVMRRPLSVLVPVLLGLLVLGVPFLDIKQAVPDAAVLPRGTESREAALALQERFPPGETSPLVVLAQVQGDPLSPSNVQALATYAAALDAMAGIDRVESPFSSLTNPQTLLPLTPEQIALLWQDPGFRATPAAAALLDAYVSGNTVKLNAISPFSPAQPQATQMIPSIRALEAGNGIQTSVGGAAAAGHDFLAAMEERLPVMAVTVVLAMLVVLFLLFGSVVLPIKAVLMTLLSLTASFGALVWIFQQGHLQGLLGFESPGYTVAGNPIIMFAVIVGLSMDYEVLLLSRIQEAWRRTGDNTASVAEGLSRTAGVITGAAMIMVVVFAAFALADTITIKSIGVGMAIAVFLDATIIRVLLVPATMRLLGDWNWWAPGPLGRLAERLGFSHVEDEDVPAEPGPASEPGSASEPAQVPAVSS